MTDKPSLKPVIWVESSRKDLREFPETVQDHMGYALYVAQRGGKPFDRTSLIKYGFTPIASLITSFGKAIFAFFTGNH